MTPIDRRRFLRTGATAAVAGLTGCSSPASEADSTPESGDSTTTATTTTTTTATTATAASGGPPGADIVAGPDALQSSVTVDATVLSSDQGAGEFVFTPAVAWVKSGATITWKVEGATHSVTAYHPDNGNPRRVPSGAGVFDFGTLSTGECYDHTFEAEGVYNYYCKPHESLGMVALVIVGAPQGGPGTTPPDDVEAGTAGKRFRRLLEVAGVGDGGGSKAAYSWRDATWESYWYSLYNMSTNISLSGNGILLPYNERQKERTRKRVKGILKNADFEKPPVVKPNLNVAPFTEGDPHFTEKPVFDVGDGRPDASTLAWERSKSSKTVSPGSLAWTHLKGVTWAKNFQNHLDVLPKDIAPKFRAQMLTTLAQLGVKFALVDGRLRKNDDNMLLVSKWHPERGVVDATPRPRHHSGMLWFLSDLVSLANDGWYGYVNSKPLIPANELQTMLDCVAKTTMKAFAPDGVVAAGSTRDLGAVLGAFDWYGTHAGSTELRSWAAEYANQLTAAVESNLESSGRVGNGATNQAATQGAIVQGLLWASQVDGVDHVGTAETVLDYLLETLWDGEAGTFASGEGDTTYRITARDAGDVTGAINAADAVLGRDGVREIYAKYFNRTFNRGRLQRAERPPSRNADAEYPLPLPPKAGGTYGQAAVYNTYESLLPPQTTSALVDFSARSRSHATT